MSIENPGNEQIPGSEINTNTTNEAGNQVNTDVTPEINTPVVDPVSQEKPADQTLPEKIKLGEKEYTQAEIEQIIKKNEELSKPESQVQVRDPQVIEAELNRTQADAMNEFVLFQKKFLAKAKPPIVTVVNPQTGQPEQQYNFAALENAFIKGVQSNNYDEFISYLDPVSVKEFLTEQGSLFSKYNQKLEALGKEQEGFQQQSQKQEDIKNWDSYISSNAKSEAEKHILNYFKDKYGFEESQQKEFLEQFRKAVALEVNKELLSTANDSQKAAMMNSIINGNPVNNNQKVFTRAEIQRMSTEEFAKHEKTIFDQMAKGLIK